MFRSNKSFNKFLYALYLYNEGDPVVSFKVIVILVLYIITKYIVIIKLY